MTDSSHDNTPAPAGDSVLTTEEVAALFRVSRNAVHAWVKAGRLTSVSPGGHHRFREDEVRAFLNGQPS